MSTIPDEKLMAFVDGQLPTDEARALEAKIEADPALQKRLEPFVVTGSPLARVFERPLHEPVPPHLVLAVERAAARAAAQAALAPVPTPTPVARFLDRAAERLGAGSRRELANAFAVVALVASGVTAGWLLASGNSTLHHARDVASIGKTGAIAGGDLAAALEKTASAYNPTTPGIQVLQTFEGPNASFCREYTVVGKDTHTQAGIACRKPSGEWQIEIHVAEHATDRRGDYETASGTTPKAIETVLTEMKQKPALGEEAEAAIISNGWKSLR